MFTENILIGCDKVKIAASAYTLIIYEERFRGRKLIKDIIEIGKIKNVNEIPFSIQAKLLWATVKTANENTADIYEWSQRYDISEIIAAATKAYGLLCKSFETRKKVKATAIRRLFRHHRN